MAHELDTMLQADGTERKAMFSVIETPWHREGVVLAEAPKTLDEALVQSGLDWDVTLKPVYHDLGNGDYLEVPGSKLVVREDRNRAVAVVGSRYRPLQNRDALGAVQPLVDNGLATWETAGSLREGRTIWGMIRFNITSPIVQEVFADEVVPFGLVSNSHDGSAVVTVRETPVRVVCANTLGMAEQSRKRRVKVRHTGNVANRTVDAALDLWTGIVERYEVCAVQYRQLKGAHLDYAMFKQLVLQPALPMPVRENFKGDGAQRRFDLAMDRTVRRRAELTGLWTDGIGHTGDHSAWEAYNALTQALDHGTEDIFPSSNRLQSLYDGSYGQLKQSVLNDLVAVAARPR